MLKSYLRSFQRRVRRWVRGTKYLQLTVWLGLSIFHREGIWARSCPSSITIRSEMISSLEEQCMSQWWSRIKSLLVWRLFRQETKRFKMIRILWCIGKTDSERTMRFLKWLKGCFKRISISSMRKSFEICWIRILIFPKRWKWCLKKQTTIFSFS